MAFRVFIGNSGETFILGGVDDPANPTDGANKNYVDSTRGSIGFYDSEHPGIVPPTGPVTGTQFLADDKTWKNPHEFIDSDSIIHALDFDVEWENSSHTMEFSAEYQIPAVVGSNGQRAWLRFTVTNDTNTNPDNDQQLETDAQITIRSPNTDSDLAYHDITVNVHNPNIAGQDWPARGTTDVATVLENNIGQNFADWFQEVDIGAPDGAFDIQFTNAGPVSITDGQSNYPIVEFTSHFYNLSVAYVQPGVDRGRTGEYPANTNATGAWHTNGRAAKDSEKVFDTVVIPVAGNDFAGLAPGYDNTVRSNPGDYFLTVANNSGTIEPEWFSAPSTANKGLVPRLPSSNQTTQYLRGDGTWNTVSAGDSVTYDSVTDAIGDVDSWFGSDTDYAISQTGGGISAGAVTLRGIGPTPGFEQNAASIFRILVKPYAGPHTDVIAGMTTGSVIRLTQGNAETVFALSTAPIVSGTAPNIIYQFQAASATHYVGTGRFDSDDPITFEFRPAPENPVVPGDIVPGAIRQTDINGGEISPYHFELEATNTPNPRQAGYIPVSAGTANGDGWTWQEYHQGTLIPAAEGINDPAIHNVFRVPATGTQDMATGTIAFTTLNVSSNWGFISSQSGANTIMIDTPPATWEDIATGANYNSFILANGSSGFNSTAVGLIDNPNNPEDNALVWFRRSDSDWGLFQWPSRSLNQSNGGAIYTDSRNLKLVASQGTPDSDMQVGLNVGISPVRIDSDFIRIIRDPDWYYGADGIWHDLAGLTRNPQLQQEIETLQEEVRDGLGIFRFDPVTGTYVARRDYTAWTADSDGVSVTLPRVATASERSALVDFFDDELFTQDGEATIHFNFVDYNGSNGFTQTNIAMISLDSDDFFSFGSDNRTMNFTLNSNASYARSTGVKTTDGRGNVTGDVTSEVGSSNGGYFAHLYADADDGRQVDMASQIETFGSASHPYGSQLAANRMFISRTSGTETTIRDVGLGGNIAYDTTANTIDAKTAFHIEGGLNNPRRVDDIAVNSGLTITVDGTRATLRGEYRGPFQTGSGYSYSRNELVLQNGRLFYNGSSGNINDPSSFNTDDWVLSAQPVQQYTAGNTYFVNELVYNASGELYRVVAATTNAPALTDTTVFAAVGGSGSGGTNDSEVRAIIDSELATGGAIDSDIQAAHDRLQTQIKTPAEWVIDGSGNVSFDGSDTLFTAVSTTGTIEVTNVLPGELAVVRVTSGGYRHYVKMTYSPRASGSNVDGTLTVTRVNTGSNRVAQSGTPTATLTLTNQSLSQLQTTLGTVSTATYLTTASNWTWSNL